MPEIIDLLELYRKIKELRREEEDREYDILLKRLKDHIFDKILSTYPHISPSILEVKKRPPIERPERKPLRLREEE
jgi:hypothetical protein